MVGNTKTGKMMLNKAAPLNNISTINTLTLRTAMPYILGLAMLTILLNGCATVDVGKAGEELKTHAEHCTTKY